MPPMGKLPVLVVGVIPSALEALSASTTRRWVGGSFCPGLKTALKGCEAIGAEVRTSLYEIKLRRFDALRLGLGTLPSALKPGAAGGSEGRLIGEEVNVKTSLVVDRGDPPETETAAGIGSVV